MGIHIHPSTPELSARRKTYRRYGAAVLIALPVLVVGIVFRTMWIGEALLLVDCALFLYGGRILLFNIDGIYHEIWFSPLAFGRAGLLLGGLLLIGFGLMAGALAAINVIR